MARNIQQFSGGKLSTKFQFVIVRSGIGLKKANKLNKQ